MRAKVSRSRGATSASLLGDTRLPFAVLMAREPGASLCVQFVSDFSSGEPAGAWTAQTGNVRFVIVSAACCGGLATCLVACGRDLVIVIMSKLFSIFYH
jgi:hypothetical protein